MKTKKLTFVLMVILFLLIGFIVGTIAGKEIGEQSILRKLSILFVGADIDIDINVNETLLVQEMNETFYPAIKEKLDGCCNEK